MTTLIARTINGHKLSLLGNEARNAFLISVDGHSFGAGSDKLEAVAAFQSVLKSHEVK